MNVRTATFADLAAILKIYARARQYMASTGNPDQWAEAYPPEDLVRKDIRGKNLYVIEDKDTLCGVFAFFPEGDPLYEAQGDWLNTLPHGAIHRVASAGTHKGILGVCVDYCLSQVNNLKIDTSPDNKIMQHQLEKYGFIPCGKVTMPLLGECIAYQKYQA